MNNASYSAAGLPALGVGLGFRPEIEGAVFANSDHIDWVEITADRFLNEPSLMDTLVALKACFPVVPHCLEMSVGSDAPLDLGYLTKIATIADAVDAPWVSDHLCMTNEGGHQLGTLAPIERSRERARNAAAKAKQAQELLGRLLLLENITYYVDMPGELTEAQFLAEVLEQSGCGLLLDLENVRVNAANHGYDPYEFLESLPLERIVQVHVAGSEPYPGIALDTHSASVSDECLALLSHLTDLVSLRGVLIERDDEFPDDFSELLTDVERARAVVAR